MIILSIADTLSELLNSGGAISIILTVGITVFAKTIIGVYNLGRRSRAELVTRKQMSEYANQVNVEMRAQKKEIQDNVVEIVSKSIESKTAELEKFSDISKEITVQMTILDEKIKLFESRAQKMVEMEDAIRIMDNKLKRTNGELETEVRRKDV